ncbi:hypothetical protein ACJX0J_038308, partial [Zea mays]
SVRLTLIYIDFYCFYNIFIFSSNEEEKRLILLRKRQGTNGDPSGLQWAVARPISLYINADFLIVFLIYFLIISDGRIYAAFF